MGMALDELKDNDMKFEDRDITYLVEKDLFNRVKPIKIDFINSPMGSGFNIVSSMSAAPSCGGSCSSC